MMMLATFSGHLGMIKYLNSPGASWEGKDLGGHTIFQGCRWRTRSCSCLVVDGAEMEEFYLYSLQRRQHCLQSEQVNFYPHVNAALIHS